MKLGGSLASVRAPTQQNLKIIVHVASYSAGVMNKVARIDEGEEERRKWKSYYRNIPKHRARLSKEASENEDNSS